MVSSGMLRRVALVRTFVSEELSASFIRVTRIGELGTTQAATSNRRTHEFLPKVRLDRLAWRCELLPFVHPAQTLRRCGLNLRVGE
jgi:hypothetical protein